MHAYTIYTCLLQRHTLYIYINIYIYTHIYLFTCTILCSCMHVSCPEGIPMPRTVSPMTKKDSSVGTSAGAQPWPNRKHAETQAIDDYICSSRINHIILLQILVNNVVIFHSSSQCLMGKLTISMAMFNSYVGQIWFEFLQSGQL